MSASRLCLSFSPLNSCPRLDILNTARHGVAIWICPQYFFYSFFSNASRKEKRRESVSFSCLPIHTMVQAGENGDSTILLRLQKKKEMGKEKKEGVEASERSQKSGRERERNHLSSLLYFIKALQVFLCLLVLCLDLGQKLGNSGKSFALIKLCTRFVLSVSNVLDFFASCLDLFQTNSCRASL